jgi:hypothetical protein
MLGFIVAPKECISITVHCRETPSEIATIGASKRLGRAPCSHEPHISDQHIHLNIAQRASHGSLLQGGIERAGQGEAKDLTLLHILLPPVPTALS